MAISGMQAFDPPAGSEIRISVDITNGGTQAGDFFVHAVTGIVDATNITFNQINGTTGAVGFTVDAGTVDSTTTITGTLGNLGILNLQPGASATVTFLSPPLDTVGFWDVGVRAGTFDIANNAIVELQDTIVAEDLIEIFIPPTAELANLQVVESILPAATA